MAPDTINGLGLCAGAAGLELGLEIALPGYRSVALVEREISVVGRIAARVQEGSIAPVAVWSDVTSFDGRPWRGIVHIIAAGFPCQPFSLAGKRAGTADVRWIWNDIERIIGEVEPAVVFLENVPGLLLDPDSDTSPFSEDLGEQSDDALGGMGSVLRSLAELGFDAEWMCLRASDVGASHARKRVFMLAYTRRAGERWATEPAGLDGSGPSGDHRRTSGDVADAGDRLFSEPWRGSERRDGPGPGSAELAEPTSVGPQEREHDSGVRQRETVERSGGSVADSAGSSGNLLQGGRQAVRDESGEGIGSVGDTESGRLGECGEPSGSIRQPDGAIEALGNAAGDDGRILQSAGRQHDTDLARAIRDLPNFAPGPGADEWRDVLVQYPWLRPSLSQEEVESHLRQLADGLAAMVVDERTASLRALGNGVVPTQAALALILLAERAGIGKWDGGKLILL